MPSQPTKPQSVTSKTSNPESVITSLMYNKLKIGKGWKGITIFTIFCLVSVLVLSYLESVDTIFKVLATPTFILIPLLSFIIYIMSSQTLDEFLQIMDKNNEAFEYYSSILTTKEKLIKITNESLEGISPTWKTYLGYVGFLLLFGLLPIGLPLFLILSDGYVFSSFPLFLIDAIIFTFWSVGLITFISQCRLILYLLEHVKSIFVENDLSILSFQKSCMKQIGSIDTITKPSDTEIPIASSHYEFHKIASKLMRATRGLALVVSAFMAELGVAMFLFAQQSRTWVSLTSFLILIEILTSLIIIMVWTIITYFEVEYTIHLRLDESRRNLVAIYDSFIFRSGYSLVFMLKEASELNEDVELSKNLVGYSLELPTWTFNPQIIGITVGSGVIIQIILLILELISRIPTS